MCTIIGTLRNWARWSNSPNQSQTQPSYPNRWTTLYNKNIKQYFYGYRTTVINHFEKMTILICRTQNLVGGVLGLGLDAAAAPPAAWGDTRTRETEPGPHGITDPALPQRAAATGETAWVQTSFLLSMAVEYSDSHPTMYAVHGRAEPVLCGQNSTEPNLFHHGETTYRVG